MTDAQRRFFDRAHDRIARLSPDLAAAYFYAVRVIANALTDSELAKLVASGSFDVVVRALLADAIVDPALMRFRRALRTTMEKSFTLNTPYLPKAGKIRGTVVVAFDHLNPRVLDALRTLDTAVVASMKDTMRDGVIARIAAGLERKESPASIARGIREIVGLPPRLVTAVDNFRTMLATGDREALTRVLRDRRFDATLARALGADGTGLSAEQIDRMVAAYRRQAIASNAENVSTTATKTAYKLAQQESWQSAIDRGIVEAGRLRKQWIGVGDDRERPSHVAMNDTIVAFDEPYPNGQMEPGIDEFNCRCLSRVFLASGDDN